MKDLNVRSVKESKIMENRIRKIQDKLESLKIEVDLAMDPNRKPEKIEIDERMKKKDYDYGWKGVMKGYYKR